MEKFIRLDIVGEWRGADHVSSMQGQGADIYFESGISCYLLDAEGMGKLYRYWTETASIDESDAKRMQVTIFEGNIVGTGTELEELADCTKTVSETPAITLYTKWKELEERFWDDVETDAYDKAEYIELHSDEILTLFNFPKR